MTKTKLTFEQILGKSLAWYGAISIAVMVITHLCHFGYNLSPSLPGKVYFTNKQDKDYIRNGEIITFKFFGEYYPHGTLLLKKVVGLPGDVVTEVDRVFYINGTPVGKAKEVDLNGNPLKMNSFRGAIPAGKFWFATDHVDGYDSRYEMAGFGDFQDVVGRSYKIW